ncbi:hypothetical protein B5S28_g918 [[Candida] boidinii]|nr:hypothetical protein B5S28_g918 [[Candida] boidinii]OWB66243.1 hypothetical protein B5S30_g1580 [[Candida] boidinii]OWB71421.1 hypothetical protein B5S31_g1109 [[Candida] boidinii]OWB79324.1 hypothetical protein B5S32_g3541 [[Candida] boidinii]OWB84972.1 hypothetical protein B5S33_g3629 [[Candida] boidinii]
MFIRAVDRTRISKSIFSTTFLIAFSVVIVNSITCPVDSAVNSDTPAEMAKARQELLLQKKLEEEERNKRISEKKIF